MACSRPTVGGAPPRALLGGGFVNRGTLRVVMTILTYTGVGIFLLPYAVGKAAIAPLLMLIGALMAVICGLLRCYFTEDQK